MGKKRTFEEISEIMKSHGFKLLDCIIKNHGQLMTIEDKQGYLYSIYFGNFLRQDICKFHTFNPYTIQNIKLWCEINNKPFKLISASFKGNKIKLQWQCLKEGCREIFNLSWSHVYHRDQGCGYCVGRQVGLSNCLATKNPELAKEWHPTRNINLTPYDVTSGKPKEVWWLCSKNSTHEWKALISDRNQGNGCPHCMGKYPTVEHNLLVNNPELCKEWNYVKNNKKPEEYCPNVKDNVWWICKECGHEWEARIFSRNGNDSGCPKCKKSKGEKECNRIFEIKGYVQIGQNDYDKLLEITKNNIYFIPQKEFKGLVGLGGRLLSYDFYLPQYNLLIEYQGEFHDGTATCQTEEGFEYQQEHDHRKREYAKVNNINLLEIWYWDYDNIETILDNYLKELSEIDSSFSISAK